MSMENVFHPECRKWISKLIKVKDEAIKLQNARDELMEPIELYASGLTKKQTPDSQKLQEEKEKEDLKNKLFNSQKSVARVKLNQKNKRAKGKLGESSEPRSSVARGRPNLRSSKKCDDANDSSNKENVAVDEVVNEVSDSGETQENVDVSGDSHFTEDDNPEIDEEEEEESSDGEDGSGNSYLSSDAEDDEEEIGLFGSQSQRSRKIRPNDELYMFDSSEESSDDDATGSGNEPKEGSSEKPESLPKNKKDAKDFKNFFDQVRDHAERTAKEDIDNDREAMISIMMNEDGMTREEAEVKHDKLAGITSPFLASCGSEVIVDKPLIKGSEMPLLAGPIPNEALRAQGALALYSALSDEPGNFQYRMSHVIDIVTNQYKGNLKYLREHGLERAHEKEFKFSHGEVIMTLSCNQPWKEVGDMLSESKTIPEPEFGYEIEILGSQTIQDLVNMFKCQSDLVCVKDFSFPELPERVSKAHDLCMEFLTGSIYPWCGIFIHDTIYVNFDKDDPEGIFQGMIDGAQAWADRHRRDDGIGKIKLSTKMDTKLIDLELRLGCPYVYIHQSINCEHLFCFTSIRLPRKSQEHSVFPRYNSIGNFPTVYCVVDKEILARWSVTNCKRLPHNPMFLCTECVKSYCLSRKNEKKRIGEDKLNPYFQLIHFLY